MPYSPLSIKSLIIIVIKVKEVPIKVYNSIRKVEQYYILLRHVYKIISSELKDVSKELTL